jgi:hypothetical protein
LETEFHHQIQFHMFRIVDFPHFDTPWSVLFNHTR